jgi:hypothetical protein
MSKEPKSTLTGIKYELLKYAQYVLMMEVVEAIVKRKDHD